MFDMPPTDVGDLIIDLYGPGRHKRAKQWGASLKHCHGAFLAEPAESRGVRGSGGPTHAPAL
jgi:hypothetical protein